MAFRDLSGSSVPLGKPASVHRPRRFRLYRNGGKRMLDIAFVLAALPFVLPLLGVLLLLASLDGHSPLYRQTRVGRGGRLFSMLKIRTMVPDAEMRLAELLERHPQAQREWDEMQKLRHDPRITPMGRFLRRSSLDELPQLWNVLAGDMSLVGPRPMLPEQQKLYPGSAYYRLRPGITGPWQISERNEGCFAGRSEHDNGYEQTLSLRGDLSILLCTVTVVLRGTGC